MAFNKAKRPSQGAGNGGGNETVAVRLKSVNLVDTTYVAEKRPLKKSKDDYIIATLLHPAFGMDVQYAENGESLTEIKITLREQRVTNPDKQGYALADFRKGAKKDSGPRMGANPIIILENASRDFKTGEISCGWLHCALPDSPAERYPNLDAVVDADGNVTTPAKFDHVHVNAWVQVRTEEDAKDRDGNPVKKQKRLMVMPDLATSVTSKEHLLASEQINYLYQDPAQGGGYPFIVLRMTQINPPMNIGTMTVWSSSNEDGSPKAPAELIEAALEKALENDKSENKDENFAFYLEHLEAENAREDSEGYVLELIPGYQYQTGPKSLPSAMKAGRRLDSDSFKSFALDDENQPRVKESDGSAIMYQMYTRAHLTVKRGEFENGPGSWYATNTHPVRLAFNGQPNARAEFHSINDIPTAVTPDVLVAHFTEAAAKRQEQARLLIPKKDAPAATNEVPADEQIPDQSGGLTPN
jgi:hypothetical protein